MDDIKRIREALSKIAQEANEALAANATQNSDSKEDQKSEKVPDLSQIGCSIKSLPARLRQKAAEHAVKVNPVNSPLIGPVTDGAAVSDPAFLTLVTGKYWGPTPRRLTVSFMESTPADLRARIILHMNAWTKSECISFAETSGIGQVRISRAGSGYWSYLGTDILLIPQNRPTMNLQGFSMNTPESEYKRVVRHETGHTLGFPHEHMRKQLVARIDPAKAYDYFRRTQGWDKATVDAQVLTSLDDRTIMGTAPDQTSIMCYQLPGAITKDGKPITGGVDINATDYAFAGSVYPKPGAAAKAQQHAMSQYDDNEDEWSDEEDVPDDNIQETVRRTLMPANGTEVVA